MSKSSELIQEKIKNLEQELKLAKQQEFLHSLKNYKWVASLTEDKQIYIFYVKTDDKNWPKLNDAFHLFDDDNIKLSHILIDDKYKPYVSVFPNMLMIHDMNMIIARSINDLLNFQKEFQLDINFESFKGACDYEINKAKKDLNKFENILSKLK